MLSNDTDVDGNTLTVVKFTVNGTDYPAGTNAVLSNVGSLVVNVNGSYAFTPFSNYNGSFTFAVTITDGALTSTSPFNITTTPVNDAPFFVNTPSNVNVYENQTAVLTVTASDTDTTMLTYSIAGVDAALFNMDQNGVLTFKTAPNYESPMDSDVNNLYEVTVHVSDGTLTATQALTVTVLDVNEGPLFTSPATVSVAENQTAVITVTASSPENKTLTYSITGADAALFNMNPNSGVLTFKTAPNYENPTNANNVYEVTVRVSDGTFTATQSLTVRVTDVNEAPVANPDTVAHNEDTQVTGNVLSNDTDVDGNTLTVVKFTMNSINYNAGTTATLSNIGSIVVNTNGSYAFTPLVNYNGSFTLAVTISDGIKTSTSPLTITTTPVNDPPLFTSSATVSVPENTTAVRTVTAISPDNKPLTYSLSGGDDASKFTINASTGALAFKTAPNFESPTDSDANNVYEVTVWVSDGTLTATQAIAVTVTNVNEAPVFTSPATASVPDNTTAVRTVTAISPDNKALTYSLSGGNDASNFSITTSGDLAFITAPSFGRPMDVGTNNVYNVIVQVSDGTLATTQAIAVTVTVLVTDTPSNLVIANSTRNNYEPVNLSWTNPTTNNFTTRELQYSINNFSTFSSITLSSNTYQFASETTGTYKFRIRANNGFMDIYSNIVGPASYSSPYPTNLSYNGRYLNYYKFSWTSPLNVDFQTNQILQGSNNIDFSNAETIHTISSAYNVNINVTFVYNYLRVVSKYGSVNFYSNVVYLGA